MKHNRLFCYIISIFTGIPGVISLFLCAFWNDLLYLCLGMFGLAIGSVSYNIGRNNFGE